MLLKQKMKNRQKKFELSDVSNEGSLPYKRGRPNFDQIFGKIAWDGGVTSLGTIGCFICGPQELIHHVSELTHHYKFQYHTETFEL